MKNLIKVFWRTILFFYMPIGCDNNCTNVKDKESKHHTDQELEKEYGERIKKLEEEWKERIKPMQHQSHERTDQKQCSETTDMLGQEIQPSQDKEQQKIRLDQNIEATFDRIKKIIDNDNKEYVKNALHAKKVEFANLKLEYSVEYSVLKIDDLLKYVEKQFTVIIMVTQSKWEKSYKTWIYSLPSFESNILTAQLNQAKTGEDIRKELLRAAPHNVIEDYIKICTIEDSLLSEVSLSVGDRLLENLSKHRPFMEECMEEIYKRDISNEWLSSMNSEEINSLISKIIYIQFRLLSIKSLFKAFNIEYAKDKRKELEDMEKDFSTIMGIIGNPTYRDLTDKKMIIEKLKNSKKNIKQLYEERNHLMLSLAHSRTLDYIKSIREEKDRAA